MANECSNPQIGRLSLRIIIRPLSFFIFLLLLLSESACRSSKIKEAELADRAGRYAEAGELYQRLYRTTTRKEPERKAYFAFRAAENYRATRNFSRAMGLYISALNYNYPDSLVLLRLGECFRANGRLYESERFYQRYLAVDSTNYETAIALKGINEFDRTDQNPYHFFVNKAGKLNSSSSDFSGCFTPDGDTFFFSTARSRNPELAENPVTGEKNNMLYFVRKDAQGKWSRPDSVPGGINNGGDVGTPSISPDGTLLYYSYVEESEDLPRTVKIYRSSKSGEGGWTEGTEIPIWTDTLRMAAHPAVSGDGKILYFVAEGGFGGKDIYSIPISMLGSGIPPTNLGPNINTPGDEMFPSIVGDSTLYFSSNGLPGVGGLDLYVAKRDSLGSWQVSHLGAPFNSPYDDFGLAFNPEPSEGFSHEGYFCSSRSDRRGFPHLYSFGREAVLTLLEGFVLDREENPIEGAVVRMVSENNPDEERVVTTRIDGYFSLELQGQTEYLLHASHPDYLNQFATFRTDSAGESSIYGVDFFLASRIKPEVFQNIYYDFDKADLREESERDLDTMIKILKENPDIVVEISSHADRKGSDAYNISLSEARAASVVRYLSNHGIALERLHSKGYGKAKPRKVSEALRRKYPFMANAECLDEDFLMTLAEDEVVLCDQLNRRTEFKVLE